MKQFQTSFIKEDIVSETRFSPTLLEYKRINTKFMLKILLVKILTYILNLMWFLFDMKMI